MNSTKNNLNYLITKPLGNIFFLLIVLILVSKSAQPADTRNYLSSSEKILIDVYINSQLVMSKHPVEKNGQGYTELDVDKTYLQLLGNGTLNVTATYDLKVDYFIEDIGSTHYYASYSQSNIRFIEGIPTTASPLTGKFTYADTLSVNYFDDSNPEIVQIRFKDEVDITRPLNIIAMDTRTKNSINRMSNIPSIQYYQNATDPVRGSTIDQSGIWYAFDSNRSFEDSLCFGGPNPTHSISSIRGSLTSSILVYGRKGTVNYLVRLSAPPIVPDLSRVTILGLDNTQSLLNDSVEIILVPAGSKGHIGTYVDRNFENGSCMFSVTTPE